MGGCCDGVCHSRAAVLLLQYYYYSVSSIAQHVLPGVQQRSPQLAAPLKRKLQSTAGWHSGCART